MGETDLVLIRRRQEDLETARQNVTEAVKAAYDAGESWGQIAEALGVTRQSAMERFRKLVVS